VWLVYNFGIPNLAAQHRDGCHSERSEESESSWSRGLYRDERGSSTAALRAFGLAKNHGFVAGNNRVTFVAAYRRGRDDSWAERRLSPTQSRRDVREDRFKHVRVVFDAERVGHSQQ
jgi:hypothetical protein